MYTKNIYLVPRAPLHPEQLFSSSKHSFQAGKGSVLHGVSGVASRALACIPEPAPAHPGSGGWGRGSHSQRVGSRSPANAPRKADWRALFDLGRKSKSAFIGQSLFGQVLKGPSGVQVHASDYTFSEAGSWKEKASKLSLFAL